MDVPDIAFEVSRHINPGDWISFISVNKLFLSFNTPEEVKKRANHMTTLVMKFPHIDIERRCLPKFKSHLIPNVMDILDRRFIKCFSLQTILDYQHLFKDEDKIWKELTSPNIPPSVILANPHKTWDFGILMSCKKKALTFYDYLVYLDGPVWDPNMSKEDLDRYIELDSFEWSLVLKYPHLEWNWTNLSFKVPFSFVKNNPDLPWNWGTLSYVTDFGIIKENLELPWNWDEVSDNKTLELDFVLQHPELPWTYIFMLENLKTLEAFIILKPFLHEQDLEDAIDLYFECMKVDFGFMAPRNEYDWMNLSNNIFLDFNLVLKYEEWYWYRLSNNRGLTFDFVLAHLNMPWNWVSLSCHPNLTFDIVLNNPHLPWIWK